MNQETPRMALSWYVPKFLLTNFMHFRITALKGTLVDSRSLYM